MTRHITSLLQISNFSAHLENIRSLCNWLMRNLQPTFMLSWLFLLTLDAYGASNTTLVRCLISHWCTQSLSTYKSVPHKSYPKTSGMVPYWNARCPSAMKTFCVVPVFCCNKIRLLLLKWSDKVRVFYLLPRLKQRFSSIVILFHFDIEMKMYIQPQFRGVLVNLDKPPVSLENEINNSVVHVVNDLYNHFKKKRLPISFAESKKNFYFERILPFVFPTALQKSVGVLYSNVVALLLESDVGSPFIGKDPMCANQLGVSPKCKHFHTNQQTEEFTWTSRNG